MVQTLIALITFKVTKKKSNQARKFKFKRIKKLSCVHPDDKQKNKKIKTRISPNVYDWIKKKTSKKTTPLNMWNFKLKGDKEKKRRKNLKKKKRFHFK